MPHLSLHTQAGDLTLFEADGAIVALEWGWAGDPDETALLRAGRDQLHAYFDGELDCFDLTLAPAGTPYRQRVWQALCDIPYGATSSYGEVAAAAGGSARSVGQANAMNPIPILIPCHRVLARGGAAPRLGGYSLGGYSLGGYSLGGYSAGDGPATKRLLLAIEQHRCARLEHDKLDRDQPGRETLLPLFARSIRGESA